MRSNGNPVFNNEVFQPGHREGTFNLAPMTVQGVVRKTSVALGITILAALVGALFPILMLPGIAGGLVFALIAIFKKVTPWWAVIGYATFQGVAIGGLSRVLEDEFTGIVGQAFLATVAIFITVLAGYRAGWLRLSNKAMRVLGFAVAGYAVFSLINLGLILTGLNTDPWGIYGATIGGFPLGILISGFAIILGSFCLVADFQVTDESIQAGVPAVHEWRAAYGFVSTIIWIYVEILRLLAILRGR